jgi:ankyrin repeat protein
MSTRSVRRALHAAAARGQAAMVEQLLASLGVLDGKSSCSGAIESAARFGQADVVDLRLSHPVVAGIGATQLGDMVVHSAGKGYARAVERLPCAILDPVTAAQRAAAAGHLLIVNMLLELPAVAAAAARPGSARLLLDEAARKGRLVVVERLLEVQGVLA